MDAEDIKQLATDVNNVALAAFESGTAHMKRPLLAKIKQLEAENKRLKEKVEFYEKYDKDFDGIAAENERLKDLLYGEEQDHVAQLEAKNKGLLELLKQVMEFIDKGQLVRSITEDHKADWALRQLPLVVMLKKIKQALKGGE